MYFNLHLTSDRNTFNYNFPTNVLEKKYAISLIKIEGTLKINNITSANNKFIYQKSKNTVDINNNPIFDYVIVKIPEDDYDFEELIKEINKQIPKNDKNFFKAKLLSKQNKVELTINEGFQIDFTSAQTVASLLGFENNILDYGKHIANKEFRTSIVDDIFLKCNLIEDIYVNENKLNSFYRFKYCNEIIEKPYIIYHKVKSQINTIDLNLVDKNNKPINCSEVNLFVELNLKEEFS